MTLKHAAQMAMEPSAVTELAAEGVETVIAEVDGSMIPIVQVAPPSEGEAGDGRKRRHLEWNEARLSLAHAKGCVTPHFAATLGDPDDAGDQLKHCALQAGMGKNTAVHCPALTVTGYVAKKLFIINRLRSHVHVSRSPYF